MEKYIGIIMKTPLFYGISEEATKKILSCMGAFPEEYGKECFIVHQGSKSKGVGILLSGSINVIKEDFLGNRTIITNVEPGEIFGEVYAALEEPQGVAVVAARESRVIFISMDRILSPCPGGCGFHGEIIRNMVRVMAQKNFFLTRKMEHLSKKTTREKLVSFLSEQSLKNKAMEFEIPFNRQELADFLLVERSALSRELSRMKEDGLIWFYKNKFILYNNGY